MPDNSLSTLRQESEESRQERLNEAYKLYQIATARYRALLEKSEGQLRSPDDPLALARHAKSEALAEYTRLLKIVTGLRGKGGNREAQSSPRTAEGKA